GAQALLAFPLPEADVAADGGPMPALDPLHVAGDLRMEDLRIRPRGEPRRAFDGQTAPDSFLRDLRGPEQIAARQGRGALEQPHRLGVVPLALFQMCRQ